MRMSVINKEATYLLIYENKVDKTGRKGKRGKKREGEKG